MTDQEIKLMEENTNLRKQLLNAYMTVESTRNWYRDQIVLYHENMLARDKKLHAYVDKVLGDQNRELLDTRKDVTQHLFDLIEVCEEAKDLGVTYIPSKRKAG